MCGICGIHNFKSAKPIDGHVLGQMNDTLVHRGPDGEGSFVDGEVGLAMRRLSIIDVEGGAQPIWNEDRTIAVVCNGEIYNYRTLGEELRRLGHVFRTHSDVESILHAYEQYGLECLEHIRGMFAFAIWDARHRRVLLARDRLGIKPLFYAATADGVCFGSEIKALLAAGVGRVLDPIALDQYCSHFYVPTPRTIFRDIRRLPPGHAMVCERGESRTFEYWDLEYAPEPFNGDEREYIDALKAHLRDAVRAHLQSDVPVGAFLSGGLDSAAVVATASGLVSEPLHTFTIGFQESSYDERVAAEEVARRFGTQHTAVPIAIQWRDVLPRTAEWFDEPFGDYAAVASFFAAELAGKRLKVVLSGDGGDEMLAGYPTHYAHRVSRLYRAVPEIVRRRLITPLVERLPTSMDRISFDYKAKRFVAGAELPFEKGHLHWKVIFSEPQKEQLYTRDFRAIRSPDGDGFATFEHYFRRVAHLDPLSQLLYVDAKTFLLDDNLTRVDRTSMANSVEVRVPLLDDNLVEFVRRVPSRVKQPRWGTKHMLRRAMTDVLPAAIVNGKKKGFTPPMPHWLRNEMRELLLETLSPRNLQCIGLFDERYVSHLIASHLEGRQDNNRQLWALMAVVSWWHQYRPSLQ